MTKYQRRQYEIRYEIENYTCYKTNSPANHMAHRIANTKENRKKHGNMIDHNYNLVPVRDLTINDSFNIGNNPEKCNKLINIICIYVNKILTAKEITKMIEGE